MQNPPRPTSMLIPTGRVVRIHFTCRAELPIGSSLRVTGSSLWAPTSLTSPSDPMNAHQISQSTASEANFPSLPNETEDSIEFLSIGHGTNMYSSSVEMVTTPEEYPVWRTRQPVVIILNATSSAVQKHYYRYLVVTPGAVAPNAEADPLNDVETMEISTSDGQDGAAPVMMWEQPDFPGMDRPSLVTRNSSLVTGSNASIPGVASTSTLGETDASHQFLHLAQLPYRTLDINVETAQVASPPPEDRLDTWNNPQDATFRPYLIRESMQREKDRASGNKPTQRRNRMSYLEERSLSAMSDEVSLSDPILSNLDGTEEVKVDLQNVVLAPPPPPKALAPKILFICFHLPVVVVKVNGEWQATWSESLLASKEGSKIVANYRAHWIGTVTPHPPIMKEEDRQAVRDILATMDCTPIFLNPSTRQAHYYGFCKQVLWPAFHNIDLLDLSTSGSGGNHSHHGSSANKEATSEWDQSRLDHWWRAYQQVNEEFSSVVQGLVGVQDGNEAYLWIHDYHLSLLPMYLSRDGTTTKFCRKVFFLHIPFPTSQIFRELECGEDILQGMLHADVVGFHAFDHARHFLNASKRIMGLNYESLVGGLIGVNYMGRTVLVSMSNVSIEPKMVEAALKLSSVAEGCQKLKETHGDRKIICGVEIGQRLSGTSLKLLAFERLLQDYPSWQEKVVMVLRVLVPGSRKRDEQITTRELRLIVQRIQEKYGTAVVDYKEVAGSTLPMDQRLALFKASDVLMLTPIREGLNHWPMEFIYSKHDSAPGVVIASEFSAVCSILNGALRVNPFDIQMTVTIMDKALSMDLEERNGRRYRDNDFVSNSPSDRWVRNVLRDLNDAYTASSTSNKGSHGNSPKPGSRTPTTPGGARPGHRRTSSRIRREEVQGTAAFLLKESHNSFTHLNPKILKQAYDATSRRVIILDFNGTIVMKEPPGKYLKREILGTSGNKPPPQVLEALSLLCRDPKNTVYVVSGDSSENVLSALGHIHNLGLAVSNGARFSPPMLEKDGNRIWQTFDLGVDWDAVKRVALPVLSKYTARSNGSFVKLTTFSIGWSYYSCDPEWGSLQASHLVLELEAELKAFDVRFVTLKGIVEIVPRKLNKGLIVKKVMRDISKSLNEPPIDFCLCLGDDISDEKMFTSVFSFIAEMGDPTASHLDPPVINENGTLQAPKPMVQKPVPDPMYSFTCAVGKKPSHASMYVTDAQEVANALVLLVKGEFPPGGVHAAWSRDNLKNMFT
ncbi:trehalose-phosphatase [Nitzschia inconspicua]|uniref:Trehalose-phosphatase n=1 Tax=Nitzschia inconspicua TaxID=303405 RepID=A0A9K3KQL7_9STRA|nr:trehalose-phosphatase [Nitzschia inconspicua]